MGLFLSLIIIMALFMGFLYLFTVGYSKLWYKMLVSNQFDAANSIMDDGGVPPKWRHQYLERLADHHQNVDRIVRRMYMKRLERLIGSISHSVVLKDKQSIIDTLREVQKDWLYAKSYKDII